MVIELDPVIAVFSSLIPLIAPKSTVNVSDIVPPCSPMEITARFVGDVPMARLKIVDESEYQVVASQVVVPILLACVIC